MKLKELTVVHIFESPSNQDRQADRKEGYALGEMLRLSQIGYYYYDIIDLTTFKEAFKLFTSRTKAKQKDYGAINLHISMHGNADGVGLTSGEFITWEMFAEELKLVASELGLIDIPNIDLKLSPIALNFSSCDGLNAHKIGAFSEQNVSLFTHVLGPNKPVAWEDSLIAFSTFYHNLLSHNVKSKDALDKMNMASNLNDVFQIIMGKKMKLN